MDSALLDAGPASLHAEQMLLCVIMGDPSKFAAAAAVVTAGDFTRPEHRAIWNAAAQLHARGHECGIVAVATFLEDTAALESAGGLSYLGEIASHYSDNLQAETYGAILREKSRSRRIIELGRAISGGGADPTADAADILALAAEVAALAGRSARSNRFNLIDPEAMAARPPAPYAVKGVLPASGLALLYGPPKSGKTFLVLDLAAALTEGRPWFGRRVRPCPVTYIGLEGEAGLSQRWRAYQIARGRGRSVAPLMFVTAPLSLTEGADVADVADAIKAAELAPGLVIVDTLNAASLGADENASADMGRIIGGAKRLQRETGGCVLLVHHSGKDTARGPRGHSSLSGALDAIIEVTRDAADRRTWCVHRAKDAAEFEPIDFRLAVVELGEDEDGDPLTSCVVEPVALPQSARQATVRRPPGGNQKLALGALLPALKASKSLGMAGAPAFRPCLEFDAAVTVAAPVLPVEKDRQRERARDALRGLVERGHLCFRDGWLWLPDLAADSPAEVPRSSPFPVSPKGRNGENGEWVDSPDFPENGENGENGENYPSDNTEEF